MGGFVKVHIGLFLIIEQQKSPQLYVFSAADFYYHTKPQVILVVIDKAEALIKMKKTSFGIMKSATSAAQNQRWSQKMDEISL